jgi:hypothetical protein
MAVNQLISTNLAAMNGGKTDKGRKESKLLRKWKIFWPKTVIDKK